MITYPVAILICQFTVFAGDRERSWSTFGERTQNLWISSRFDKLDPAIAFRITLDMYL